MELDLKLPLSSNVDRSALSRLTFEAIQFILFQRQQIPDPVVVLKKIYTKEDKHDLKSKVKLNSAQTRQRASLQKQVTKFLENLNLLENSLDEAFKHGFIQNIQLVIGSTPLTPKEIFSIDTSRCISDGNPTTVSAQVLKLCCRRLCAELLQLEDFFINSPAPSSVHIFVKAKKGSSLKTWIPWTQYKVHQKKLQLSIAIIPDHKNSQKTEENKENLSSSCRSSTKTERTQPHHEKTIIPSKTALSLRAHLTSDCPRNDRTPNDGTVSHNGENAPQGDSATPADSDVGPVGATCPTSFPKGYDIDNFNSNCTIENRSTKDIGTGDCDVTNTATENGPDSVMDSTRQIEKDGLTEFIWYKSAISIKGFKY